MYSRIAKVVVDAKKMNILRAQAAAQEGGKVRRCRSGRRSTFRGQGISRARFPGGGFITRWCRLETVRIGDIADGWSDHAFCVVGGSTTPHVIETPVLTHMHPSTFVLSWMVPLVLDRRFFWH